MKYINKANKKHCIKGEDSFIGATYPKHNRGDSEGFFNQMVQLMNKLFESMV